MWHFTPPEHMGERGRIHRANDLDGGTGRVSVQRRLPGGRRQERCGQRRRSAEDGLGIEIFRRASVEIDAVQGSELPLENGAGIGWTQVFDTLGWDVTVKVSETNVAELSGRSWADSEMHQAMLAHRDAINLDTEWRYHILAVKLIDSTPRGIMYDADGTDSNNVPREGVGIATHWVIPDTPEWGLVRGIRFGLAKAPFFRTAVHELGHVMALFHTTVDNGYMNTTDLIAASATSMIPFPNNIKWAYAEQNLKQLRHYPDVFVRPGGTPFGTASTVAPPISPTDSECRNAVPDTAVDAGCRRGADRRTGAGSICGWSIPVRRIRSFPSGLV